MSEPIATGRVRDDTRDRDTTCALDPMRRIVLRMPDALINGIDQLASALDQRLRVGGTGRASRAGATRTLIAAVLDASKERPVAEASWAFARRRRPGESMRRIVLRMPAHMVERIAQLRAELRARQPAEPWPRALVMRGLLAAGLTSPRPAVILEAARPTGGAADRGEA